MPHERQTSRLLGYPDDARLLIINADDFGMCHAVNDGILQTLLDGVVMSTSLMVPCPWAPHAMRMLREHPEIPFAVHLTVICDFSIYRWGPVTPWDKVPSLLDEKGGFFPGERKAELLAQARLDELEVEFRAQIEPVLAAGLTPTHLDWHTIADGGRADIFELTFGLAREHGLALRVHDRTHAEALQRKGLPVNDHPVLDSYRLDPSEKPAVYARLLRELPPGLSEWAVHPSLGDAEAQTLEPDTWRVRRTDFDFVMSQEARDIIDEEGIVLLDYRALQEVWTR